MGTFVFEYTGDVLYSEDMDTRMRNKGKYAMNLDANWRLESECRDAKYLSIDASRRGNVARFLNHRYGSILRTNETLSSLHEVSI